MFAVFSTILQISVSQPVCRDALVCREISSGVPPNLKIPYITCKSCFFHNIGLLLHFGVPPTKKGWEPLLQMEDFSNNYILFMVYFTGEYHVFKILHDNSDPQPVVHVMIVISKICSGGTTKSRNYFDIYRKNILPGPYNKKNGKPLLKDMVC